MRTRIVTRVCGPLVVFLVATVAGVAAERSGLSDAELAEIHAQGVTVFMDFTISPQAPGLLQQQAGVCAGIAPTGPTSAPTQVNAGSLNLSSIMLSGNALQNTQNLFNVIVQGGDVGIGVNIQVVVNPTNSNFVMNSANYNFAQMFAASNL